MAQQIALEAMHTWLMELGNEGRSQGTIRAYEADVEDTLAFVAGQKKIKLENLELAKIDRDILVAGVAEFRTRPDPRYRKHPEHAPKERSPARLARRISAIRVFFRWCYETGRISADPAALLRTPKKGKRLPKALQADTARSVIDTAEEGRWPERDILILVLALTTGMRLEEMATLKLVDLVNKPPSAINVIGKGNKERRLPLAPVAQEALAVYLPTRAARLRKFGVDARTLLISSRPRIIGTAKDGTQIVTIESSKAGVAYVVDRVLRRVGARRRGSRVHVLRHTFATLGLRPDSETGHPAYTLRQLQAALGHANLATIQVYTEVTDAELVKAAQAHPLARAAPKETGS